MSKKLLMIREEVAPPVDEKLYYETHMNYPLSVTDELLYTQENSYITEIYGNTLQNDLQDKENIISVGEPQNNGLYKIEVTSYNEDKSESYTSLIYLPQPLRGIGDCIDKLYWDEEKNRYCIEQNVLVKEVKVTGYNIDNQYFENNIQSTDNINFTWAKNYFATYGLVQNNYIEAQDWGVKPTTNPFSIAFYNSGLCRIYHSEDTTYTSKEDFINIVGSDTFNIYIKMNTPKTVEVGVFDKITLNTYSPYIEVHTDEIQSPPTNMTGVFPFYEKTNPIEESLVLCLNGFDSANRRVYDTVGDVEISDLGSGVTVHDDHLTVGSVTTAQGSLTAPFSTLTEFTVSYVVRALDDNWDNILRQFISGNFMDGFYFWIGKNTYGSSNVWYNRVKVVNDRDYQIQDGDPRFIDITINVTTGITCLYINGEFQFTSTKTLTQATNNTLYLNNTAGVGSAGCFDLYSFKIYNRCLTVNEVAEVVKKEKERLNW